jgi:hypothetical protein
MIGSQIRAQVRERAQNACEYCHLHQDDSPLAALHVEHIIPKTHGGSDDLDDLALACVEWQGIYLSGKTARGRTTIRVLNMNSDDQAALRSS